MTKTTHTPIPTYSFWGRFTRKGRITNQWALALAESDPAKRLHRFWKVQRQLAARPDSLAHLWLPFLDSFLRPPYVQEFSRDDLAKLEDMGATLAGLDLSLQPADVWWRLVAAYDQRGESSSAEDLLTRTALEPTSSSDVKLQCARSLARRGARRQEHLSLYVASLRGLADPTEEEDIFSFLSWILQVDFDSNQAALTRAAEVARQLQLNRVPMPGGQRAIGLHCLLVAGDLPEAVLRLEKVLKKVPRDEIAYQGLLAALIQLGQHDRVEKLPKESWEPANKVIMGLHTLNTTLKWLDDGTLPGPPPAAAEELEALPLAKYVGTIPLAMAMGRLHLLEGHASRAAEILSELADRLTSQPRWHYYAAWATALAGKRDLVDRYRRLPQWPARWSVVALLADLDPHLAAEAGCMASLQETPPPFDSLVQARLAMAQGKAPSPGWDRSAGAATLEEQLEGLRTSLGSAVFQQDQQNLAQLLASPLFDRLPRADQLMWRGLHALLQGRTDQAKGLLTEAAGPLGHPRAALLLATFLLQTGTTPANEVCDLLDRFAPPGRHLKTDLLRAYAYAREGTLTKAQELLEPLATGGNPRALFALGNLYIGLAEQARQTADNDQTRLYRQQAAHTLAAAAGEADGDRPAGVPLLATCAGLWAYPDRQDIPWTALAQEASGLPPKLLPRWAAWTTVVFCLTQGGAAVAAAVTPLALELLAATDSLDEHLINQLAREVARTCSQVEDIASAQQMVHLLNRLRSLTASAEVRRLQRLGLAAAWRSVQSQTPAAPEGESWEQAAGWLREDIGNGPLALMVAAGLLAAGHVDRAAELLHGVSGEDALAGDLCRLMADLLTGTPPSQDALPSCSSYQKPAGQAACHLLRAAMAFMDGKAEDGCQEVFRSIQLQGTAVNEVFPLGRFIPRLAACAARRHVPATPIRDVLLDALATDRAPAAAAARCAAALGAADLACRLWDQCLNCAGPGEADEVAAFSRYLCHLATQASKSGDILQAAARLRQASQVLHSAQGHRP